MKFTPEFSRIYEGHQTKDNNEKTIIKGICASLVDSKRLGRANK
jgi:hypothetical protein